MINRGHHEAPAQLEVATDKIKKIVCLYNPDIFIVWPEVSVEGDDQYGKQILSLRYMQNIVCLKDKILEEDQLDSSNIFDVFSFIKYKVKKETDE